MSSAVCFNFDQSKILSSGNGLNLEEGCSSWSKSFDSGQPAGTEQADRVDTLCRCITSVYSQRVRSSKNVMHGVKCIKFM